MGGAYSYFQGYDQTDNLYPGYDPKKLVTREQWGALPPLRPNKPLKLPIDKVRYGYTHTDMCYNIKDCAKIIRDLQIDFMDFDVADIPHNFLVGADGNIYEGIGWHFESELVQGDFDLMGRTLDVALIGPFRERCVPEHMIDAAMTVTNFGVRNKFIKEPYDAEQYYFP